MERSKAYKVYSVLMLGWMVAGVIILFGFGYYACIAWFLGGFLMPNIERKNDPIIQTETSGRSALQDIKEIEI